MSRQESSTATRRREAIAIDNSENYVIIFNIIEAHLFNLDFLSRVAEGLAR